MVVYDETKSYSNYLIAFGEKNGMDKTIAVINMLNQKGLTEVVQLLLSKQISVNECIAKYGLVINSPKPEGFIVNL